MTQQNKFTKKVPFYLFKYSEQALVVAKTNDSLALE